MSLHVDLIYPGEQRSGMLDVLRSATRVSAMAVPLILVFAIGWSAFRIASVKAELDALETRWSLTQPRQRNAQQEARVLGRNRKILEQLEAWQSAAVPWAPQLHALIESTPPSIQLRQLSAVSGLGGTRRGIDRERQFSMTLVGTTRAEIASKSILALEQAFATHPAWTNWVQTAQRERFDQDLRPGAHPDDREFEIAVKYRKLTLP